MNDIALLNRRIKVAEMYFRGKTMDTIAAEMNISQGTVSNDVATVRERFVEMARGNLEQLKADAIGRLDEVYRIAWIAFGVVGRPEFLRIALQCIEMQAKMHGLFAPINLGVTSSFPWEQLLTAALADAPDPVETRFVSTLQEVQNECDELRGVCEVSRRAPGETPGAG